MASPFILQALYPHASHVLTVLKCIVSLKWVPLFSPFLLHTEEGMRDIICCAFCSPVLKTDGKVGLKELSGRFEFVCDAVKPMLPRPILVSEAQIKNEYFNGVNGALVVYSGFCVIQCRSICVGALVQQSRHAWARLRVGFIQTYE